MYSWLHDLLCLSLYVVLHAWGGRVRYSGLHFVATVRCLATCPLVEYNMAVAVALASRGCVAKFVGELSVGV